MEQQGNAPRKFAEKVNILLVDNQPARLLSYEAILDELGENLIKATSGTEALNLLFKNDVAVVLANASLPGIDGLKLADMVCQHPRLQATAILFIHSPQISMDDRITGYQDGTVEYIPIPVVPDVLRAKVGSFAELHRKRRQQVALNCELEHRVRERTQELERRAELLDMASDAIIFRDMSGMIRFWNSGAESLYGWRRAEALGKSLHKLLSTRFPVPVNEVESRLFRTGRWEGNLVQRTRDGRPITVACRKVLKNGTAGSPGMVLEIGRDITAGVRAEESFRNAENLAAMGRVAGMFAHEINNPLEAILNIFHLLHQHSSLHGDALNLACTGEKETLRVGHIVRHTLSLYREFEEPITVSIAEVLDDILELQSQSFELQGIVLEKRYRTEASIQGFPDELKELFMNLVVNAIEAMQAGGRLRISLRQHIDSETMAHYVSVFVTDTGCGIEPEHTNQLFEPFFTTKSTKGTGLGLWISKGIVQKYDGSIHFRSIRHLDRSATCLRVVIPS